MQPWKTDGNWNNIREKKGSIQCYSIVHLTDVNDLFISQFIIHNSIINIFFFSSVRVARVAVTFKCLAFYWFFVVGSVTDIRCVCVCVCVWRAKHINTNYWKCQHHRKKRWRQFNGTVTNNGKRAREREIIEKNPMSEMEWNERQHKKWCKFILLTMD